VHLIEQGLGLLQVAGVETFGEPAVERSKKIPTKLEGALVAYREALKELKRERVPLDWATTQTSLAWVLFRIGEHESGKERLEEAIAVYREALKEHRSMPPDR
jgi:hypothetical protein